MSTFAAMRSLPLASAVASLCLLLCCIHAPVGQVDAHDAQCGQVGPVAVRMRSAVAAPWGMGCREALETVRRYLPAELHGPWTVEWTGGWAGLTETEGSGAEVDGMTYPAASLIVVTASHPWVLHHEFLHALDVEAGRPNRRDGP